MKPPKIKKEKPSDEKKALSTGFQKTVERQVIQIKYTYFFIKYKTNNWA